MAMCPAAAELSNTLQFVKASYCEGEIDTEEEEEKPLTFVSFIFA